MTSERYPHVFSPLLVGNVELRNRIFVPAHTTSYGDDNLPTDRHLAYHQARAAGGVGLIIFEAIRVHRSSLGRIQGVNGYERECIPRFRKVADAVHAEGAKLFGQIIHLGRHIDGNYTRTPSWGASAIPWTATAPVPHPMTVSEIREVVSAHADTACHLIEAGLDGIELQMAHGHLLQQFMSPATNKRDDDYGGSLENRIRFATESLAAVRAAIGEQSCLGIRISADEYMPDGLDLNDMTVIVKRLLRDTSVDFVHVSHSAYHGSYTISTQMADMSFPAGTFQPLTIAMSKALDDLPRKPVVMTVCQYRTVQDAEEMLATGSADLIGMARAHIADPALVNKAREGREADTIPCIGCNQGCAGMLAQNLAITCLTNPVAGRERQWPALSTVPTQARRKCLVIGGGPAGAEAAATAAALGHHVELWEQSSRLGGALNWTTKMPLRAEFQQLLASQCHRIAKYKVDVRLDTCATPDAVAGVGADTIVVATGATAEAVDFDEGDSGLTLEQALDNTDALGAAVIVLDVTGSWAVASTVEYLADLGKQVTIVTPGGAPAWGINIYSLFAVRRRWVEKKIRIIANHAIHSVTGTSVQLKDLSTNDRSQTLSADAVVAPTHGRSNSALYDGLLRLQAEGELTGTMLSVGDCQAPRTALEAVFEGHEAARSLVKVGA